MRMVASAKLHRTQRLSQNFLRYSDELRQVVEALRPGTARADSTPLQGILPGQAVAVVPISSNSGLCGAFNANVMKATETLLARCQHEGIHTYLFPVGQKVADYLRKRNEPNLNRQYVKLADAPDMFARTSQLVADLRQRHADGEISQAILLYHHFQSMGRQILTTQVLPLAMQSPTTDDTDTPSRKIRLEEIDYLTEPAPPVLADMLHPRMLNAQTYSILLDALTSEHAARMLAMQTADDNANELLQELTLLYNKTRQQAITAELIDIMGGQVKSN